MGVKPFFGNPGLVANGAYDLAAPLDQKGQKSLADIAVGPSQ